ncbi:MAG: bifunctional UDP-N-acetylglucosamine diphosphorylase/glucosamine-1-phosphate N-acetyltransferase GlmU [Bacteroidota bacterium]|jgi:bifunctional UDP-N-acetylglucosamine pyrophosphorylase/glucosamine-1-phosphate N-acetyltransferase
MDQHPLMLVILAAGKGTRMKSARPKVLHRLAGRTLLGHALALGHAVKADRLAVVVGPAMEDVVRETRRLAPDADIFVQEERLGTAHAVLAARGALETHRGDVVVLFADTPLLRPETILALRQSLASPAGVAVLGFEAADPTGYGRLLMDGSGAVTAIREHGDASEAERQVRLCNSGVMAFRTPDLVSLLGQIGRSNAKGEYYLTDAIAAARGKGMPVSAMRCAEEEVLGINSRDQLAAAEAIWQRRARLAVMREGATLIAPDTVWLSHDTVIGRDVVIEPNVFLGPGVIIEDGVTIKANCHLEGTDGQGKGEVRVRKGAVIGPFARLRPGADIGKDAHIGNFVEIKNALIEEGAKANHLTYIGDARVGARANVGAGTITCNYDGFTKSHTDIGAGAFIGSNTALVAPVRVGDNAYVGAGSVISGRDVEAGSLAVVRGERSDRPGWVAKFRSLMERRKSEKKKTAAGE